MAGLDSNDSTSAAVPVPDYRCESRQNLAGLRIGVPEDYFGPGLDPEVKAKVRAGIALLEKLGCQRVPQNAPHGYAIATYYIVATAEASSNLARFEAYDMDCESRRQR